MFCCECFKNFKKIFLYRTPLIDYLAVLKTFGISLFGLSPFWPPTHFQEPLILDLALLWQCLIYSDHVSNKNITVDLRSNKLSLQIKSSKKPNSPNKKKRKKKSSHLGTTIDVTITQIVHVHTSIICIKYTLTIYKKCAIKI